MKRVVEIGSGFSTLLTLKALDKNERGRLEAYEPYPPDALRATAGHPRLKLDPKLADANLRLADLYARQDLVNEAREMYLKAARQFLERNDVTRSRETYEKLLRLEPDRVETHVAFGEMLEGAGDHARAAAELAAAAGLLASRWSPSSQLVGVGSAGV